MHAAWELEATVQQEKYDSHQLQNTVGSSSQLQCYKWMAINSSEEMGIGNEGRAVAFCVRESVGVVDLSTSSNNVRYLWIRIWGRSIRLTSWLESVTDHPSRMNRTDKAFCD